jgi:hypothetical protein
MATTPAKNHEHGASPNTCNTSSQTMSSSPLAANTTRVAAYRCSVVSQSSFSDSKAPSIASTSVVEAKMERAHQEHDQQRAPVATTPSTLDSGHIEEIRQRLPFRTLLAFIALCLSIFLVALDTVLIPTALPTIALSFHIRDSLYAWIGSAYLLANAASGPFWGKLSDVFGRKPVILAADLIFLVGSVVCAVSTNAIMLIAGRVIQGFGGGGVVVLVHVCVSDLFPIRYVLPLFLFPCVLW